MIREADERWVLDQMNYEDDSYCLIVPAISAAARLWEEVAATLQTYHVQIASNKTR